MTQKKQMICNDCGKMLPEDSKFCQYCGSKNVSEYIEPKPVYYVPTKICKICGKQLPEDSEFCQYCGSKYVYEERATITENNSGLKHNVLLIPLIIVSLLACGLGYGMYHNYMDYNALQEENTRLNNDVQKARKDSSQNQLKASYYNEVLTFANNSKGYSDFYARQTLLRNPNKQKVWIYFGHYDTSISFQTSSGFVNAEWGNWDGHWIPLTITYTGSGVEYVKLSNDYNSETFYITIVGD